MISIQIINKKIVLFAALKKVIIKVQDINGLLAINQKLYIKALMFLIIYLLFPKAMNPELDKVFLALFLLTWISAIGYDSLNIYKKIYETVVGKAVLLLLLTMFTNIAIGLSAQVINDVTGVNPSSFPHTQAILAIFMIPLLMVVISAFLYISILILGPFILMFHFSDDDFKKLFIPGYSVTNKVNYLKITKIAQVVSLTIFLGLIYGFSQRVNDNYSTFVSDAARFFVYNIEMYSKAPCVIERYAKIAFIGDDKILVGIKNKSETVFKLAECKPQL